MKAIIYAFALLFFASCTFYSGNTDGLHKEIASASGTATEDEKPVLKSGDIVFQNAQSGQCKAIELATHSQYTHCGIIFWKNNKCYVLEAVQPVCYTLFDDWVERGLDKHYAAKRLKDQSILTDSILTAMQKDGEKYLDKDYDIYFGWGNDKIYCSELVWKIYKETTGLEIGELHKLKDFDLTSKEVKQIMKQRYGNDIPYDEQVVSPSNIYDSSLLETVIE
jgi:uncharacterized protein YycO